MPDRIATRRAVSTALGVIVMLAIACANSTPVAPPPVDPGPFERDTYVIGPADVLRISVWNNPELSLDVPVRPDGKISTPLLDDIQAAGLTPTELKEILTKRLGEFVTSPDVTVIVTGMASKRVYVVGEVARSSAVPLLTDMRVLDVIASVGGFTPFANTSKIRILRPDGEGSVVEYRFDYEAFLRGEDPESNLLMRPGDTLVVPD